MKGNKEVDSKVTWGTWGRRRRKGRERGIQVIEMQNMYVLLYQGGCNYYALQTFTNKINQSIRDFTITTAATLAT